MKEFVRDPCGSCLPPFLTCTLSPSQPDRARLPSISFGLQPRGEILLQMETLAETISVTCPDPKVDLFQCTPATGPQLGFPQDWFNRRQQT